MKKREMVGSKVFLLIGTCTMAASAVLSQSPMTRGRNNPYSPSPAVESRSASASNAKSDVGGTTLQRQFAFSTTTITIPPVSGTIQGPVVPTRAADAAVVYRIDSGDVLFIGVKNNGASGNYYTVRPDGTIDLLSAGQPLRVRGLTTDELRTRLDNQADVRVREYNSHKVKVTGLVDRPGDISLQRDAMPIFALRAQAGTTSAVEKVVITRANTRLVESYMFNLPGTDNVLVYPGDIVEFAASTGKN